jgi:hypothetical protein
MNGSGQGGRLALVAGIIFGGALLACQQKREPLSFVPNPSPVLGQYYKLTVESARECDVGKDWARPKKGFVHLGVEMIFEATTDERVAVHSYELKLVAPGGQSYSSSLGQCQPELPNGVYVKSGERLRGLLTFEVPENAGELVLVDSNMVSPAKGMDEVRVVLSRVRAAAGARR